jgi:hypothetical protein
MATEHQYGRCTYGHKVLCRLDTGRIVEVASTERRVRHDQPCCPLCGSRVELSAGTLPGLGSPRTPSLERRSTDPTAVKRTPSMPFQGAGIDGMGGWDGHIPGDD